MRNIILSEKISVSFGLPFMSFLIIQLLYRFKWVADIFKSHEHLQTNNLSVPRNSVERTIITEKTETKLITKSE